MSPARPSATSVAASNCPDTGTPFDAWNLRSPSIVREPAMPSGVPTSNPARFRASCARFTVSLRIGLAGAAGVLCPVEAAAAAPRRPRAGFFGAALGAPTGAHEAPLSDERYKP
jgi:hypothetical protein